MLQHRTQKLKVASQKLQLKTEGERSIFIFICFFSEMVGFIKLHCIQVRSNFYEAACPRKKEQSHTSGMFSMDL